MEEAGQLDLPQVPVSGKDTSFSAYEQIKASGLVSKLQMQVVSVLFTHSGMTANEIAFKLNIVQRDCVRPRLTELKNLGVVEAVAKRRCAVSGKVCLVWSFTGRVPTRNVTEMVRCPHCHGKGKLPRTSVVTGA